jgi:hypothetical protein
MLYLTHLLVPVPSPEEVPMRHAALALLAATAVACTPDQSADPTAPLAPPGAASLSEGTFGIQSHGINAVITSSAFTGERDALEGAFTPPITDLPGGALTGQVVHVGVGCPAHALGPGSAEDPYLADPAGKIALIERSNCRFDQKIARAQLAGATGVIVFNHAAGGEAMVSMGGDNPAIMPDNSTVPITISAAFVQRSTGLLLRDGSQPVTATVYPVPPTPERHLTHVYDTVEDLLAAGSLSAGQAQSLRAQLNAIARHLARGNSAGAANLLHAFINHVNSLEASGVLSVDDANMLRALAQAVLDAL